MKSAFRVATFLVFVLAVSAVILAKDDHSIGTWKLNVSESTFTPGPAPKSEIRTYEAIDNGVKMSREMVDENGKTTSSSLTAKYDGQDHPLDSGGAEGPYDSIAFKQVNAYTVDVIQKKMERRSKP